MQRAQDIPSGRGPGAGAPKGAGIAPASAMPPQAAARLVEAGLTLITDPDVLAGHCRDWTGRWTGPAVGLVRPRDSAQVAAALSVAREFDLPVQIQGGNTGLVGGSVPGPTAALIVLTSGLDQLNAVDETERTVVVGAGVTAAVLAAHAEAAGLHLGLDLASRDSATLGGMVATNAGGIGVVAHGMTGDQVRGLTAVLGDGRIVGRVGRPRKDNTGLDVARLLIGSEGTLGVITEVEVALQPDPGETSVALLPADDLATAIALARRVQARGTLLAAEVVDSEGVAMAARALGVADPLPPGVPWLLLLDVADGGTGHGLQPVGDEVLALGLTPAQRRRLWDLRERQTELRAAAWGSDLIRLDVSVRLAHLDEAVRVIRAIVAKAASDVEPRVREAGSSGRPCVGFFGHALDGNLHVQLVGGPTALADEVLLAVARLGGSISAEHGIGRAKAPLLELARSPEEIAWMRQVKQSADPLGLLNPGVLHP